MLKAILIMAFALFGTIGNVHSETPPLNYSSKPTLVIFYADWCGSCKILEPKLEQAMGMLENKDALKIVRFDLTDDTTKAKSADMAGENGLTDIYNAHAPKTGFIVMAQNGQEMGRLTKSDDVATIKAKLETFVTSTGSDQ